MRVVLNRILLAAGAVSLTVCIVFAVHVGQSYQRAVVKDDFVGFSLGLHFLLYGLLPLTLSLFVAACLLDPPTWLLRRLGIGAPTFKSSLTTSVVVLCLAGAAAIFLYVAVFAGGNLMSAARHYGYGGRGLATILLQNLVLSAPLLILSVLLAWAARALHRRPTG
ncbi:MAG: hypothetical protein U9R72_12785 [Chloroflexota bacterium]|nr:hypothetical protein [Chloroflexota bacterium]